MTPIDVAILEWLEEKGMAAPPMQIFLYFPGPEDDRPTKPHVHRRLAKLREHEMIERHPEAESYYRITDKGLRYLNDPNATAEEFMPEEDDEEEEDDDRDDGELEDDSEE